MTKTTAKQAISMMDRIFSEVNPLEAAVMILGGTAAANGVVPPMTQLLSAITGELTTTEQWSGIPQGDWVNNQGINWVTVLFGTNPPFWVPKEWYEPPPPPNPPTPEQKNFASKRLGLFCSGAVEALIMYNLARNPDAVKGLIALPGQILQGVGEIIPG